MTYRKFDTGTWQDPWFEGLGPLAKLAFIYLWTNESCNQAGIYEISKKRISFDLGYHIDTIYSEVDSKIQWFCDRNVVWVKNFFGRQCQNSKFAIAAINSIKEDPFKLSVFISYNRPILDTLNIDPSTYHIDTIPIPEPTEQNRTEQKQNSTVSTPQKSKKFKPPSVNEVVSYFLSKGYSAESAKKAFDYYEAGNWKDSTGKQVKSWKQKMNGVWFKSENKVKEPETFGVPGQML